MESENMRVGQAEYLQVRAMVSGGLDPMKNYDEEMVAQLIDEVIDRPQFTHLSVDRKLGIRRRIFNDIKKLDILQELIDDDDITEIMVNGYRNIFIEKAGRLLKWDGEFESREALLDVVQRIAARSNKIINETVPIVDTRLDNGSRVNIVMNPVAIDGPIITIRKFYEVPLSIDKMIEIGSISNEAATFLESLVCAKYNIFISGGTGSGKTTFLNAMSNYIPLDERVITIEDSAELRLNKIENLVRLEARNANVEGKNAVSIHDLIRSALRMRPDRIVVGECRGMEALDMLQAMNTGHDGSLSTGHANGPKEMLMRLETMVLEAADLPVSAIRSQIASAIDIIVHLGRLRDRSRKVLSISEVAGIKDGEIILNPLYEFKEERADEKGRIVGALKGSSERLIHKEKLRNAGF